MKFADQVVLNEGERRVVLLRLEPLGGAAKAPPRSAPGPSVPAPTSWLGVRYYGVVLPKFVMNLVDRLVVMSFGAKLAEGKPKEVSRDPVVLEAYLGGVAQ